MFQSSFNCESSLRFFSAEFPVEFSFSFLTWKNLSSRLLFNFTFISWEVPFKKRVTKPFCWLKSFVPLQFGPWIRTEGLNSSSRQKEDVTFWRRSVWNYFSVLHSGQTKSHTQSARFFYRFNTSLCQTEQLLGSVNKSYQIKLLHVRKKYLKPFIPVRVNELCLFVCLFVLFCF